MTGCRPFAAAAAVLCVPTTLGLVPHTPVAPLAARRPSAAPSWSGVGGPSGGHCGRRHRATPTATAMSSTAASPRGGYYDDGAWGDEDDFYTSDEWLGIADDRWEQWCNADVLPPPEDENAPLPLAVVHLVGGTVVGTAPRVAYEGLARGLAANGFLVIATRHPLGPQYLWNHQEMACCAARDFRQTWRCVEERYGRAAAARLPLIGVGHSLGAKLLLLLCSYTEVCEVASPVPRVANVLLSYNNFGAQQSVPLLKELRVVGAEVMGDVRGEFGAFAEGMGDYVAGVGAEGGGRGRGGRGGRGGANGAGATDEFSDYFKDLAEDAVAVGREAVAASTRAYNGDEGGEAGQRRRGQGDERGAYDEYDGYYDGYDAGYDDRRRRQGGGGGGGGKRYAEPEPDFDDIANEFGGLLGAGAAALGKTFSRAKKTIKEVADEADYEPLKQSVAFAEKVVPKAKDLFTAAVDGLVAGEFEPSPSATEEIVAAKYSVPANLVVQFREDALDQSPRLATLLTEKFGAFGAIESPAALRQFVQLPGSHLTPNAPARKAEDDVYGPGGGGEGLDDLVEALTRYITDRALWKRDRP